jgi:phenylalanyl-tRNA synthetase alpha chain
LLIAAAATALSARWGCEARLRRSERVVTVAENYDKLGFGGEVVTRDARYTRYVDGLHMLRSHSSAIVPTALEELAAEAAGGSAPDDIVLVCPGICYRRDSIDREHTGTPHQLDLWRVSRRAPHEALSETDLDEMIDTLCKVLVPGRRHRVERREHPYTLAGRQIDVEWEGAWVEIAECGLAHPDLLRRCGLGPQWSGLALGMGLDRLLMLVKGVPDIGLLRSLDPRVSEQMATLAQYRPTSAMPAVRRDLSIAVDAGEQVEDLGDRVRESLGDDAEMVEEVVIVSATPREELPQAARQRLGIEAGQANLLVRVTLRSFDRTLSDEEANALRDRVYGALHRGHRHQWASRSGSAPAGLEAPGTVRPAPGSLPEPPALRSPDR